MIFFLLDWCQCEWLQWHEAQCEEGETEAAIYREEITAGGWRFFFCNIWCHCWHLFAAGVTRHAQSVICRRFGGRDLERKEKRYKNLQTCRLCGTCAAVPLLLSKAHQWYQRSSLYTGPTSSGAKLNNARSLMSQFVA